jgi:hypothetical protein
VRSVLLTLVLTLALTVLVLACSLMRTKRWAVGLLGAFGLLAFLVYAVEKPALDRARADYQRVMTSDGGAIINGHLTVPRRAGTSPASPGTEASDR